LRNHSNAWITEIQFKGKDEECTTGGFYEKSFVWNEFKLHEREVIIGVYGSYYIDGNTHDRLKTLGFILGK
jgi:hypothetical protein